MAGTNMSYGSYGEIKDHYQRTCRGMEIDYELLLERLRVISGCDMTYGAKGFCCGIEGKSLNIFLPHSEFFLYNFGPIRNKARYQWDLFCLICTCFFNS